MEVNVSERLRYHLMWTVLQDVSKTVTYLLTNMIFSRFTKVNKNARQCGLRAAESAASKSQVNCR